MRQLVLSHKSKYSMEPKADATRTKHIFEITEMRTLRKNVNMEITLVLKCLTFVTAHIKFILAYKYYSNIIFTLE